jgi:cell division protein FtsB|tara:strand:+ start:612 stop:935 length:324 start_codon:yes stop_codon:yes gene_type:complete
MAKKRLSKKTQDIIYSLLFFSSTIIIILSLITYLWVYTEIDETLLAIEIQSSTANELQNEIREYESKIESLSRADVIAKKAKSELGMVFTEPETLRININNQELAEL